MHINETRRDDVSRFLTPELIKDAAENVTPVNFAAKYCYALTLEEQGNHTLAKKMLKDIYTASGDKTDHTFPSLKRDAKLLALDIIRAENPQPDAPLDPLAIELSKEHPFAALLRAKHYASQTPRASVEAFAWLRKAIDLHMQTKGLSDTSHATSTYHDNGFDPVTEADEHQLYQEIFTALMPATDSLVAKLNARGDRDLVDNLNLIPEELKYLTLIRVLGTPQDNESNGSTGLALPTYRHPTINGSLERLLGGTLWQNTLAQIAYLSYAVSEDLAPVRELKAVYNANKDSNTKDFFKPAFSPIVGTSTRRPGWGETRNRTPWVPNYMRGVAMETVVNVMKDYVAACWYVPYYPIVLPLYGFGRLLDYATVFPALFAYEFDYHYRHGYRGYYAPTIFTPYQGLNLSGYLIFSLLTTGIAAIAHLITTAALLIVTLPVMLLAEVCLFTWALIVETVIVLDRVRLMAFGAVTKTDDDMTAALKKAFADPTSAISCYVKAASNGKAEEAPPAYDGPRIPADEKPPSAPPPAESVAAAAPPAGPPPAYPADNGVLAAAPGHH